MIRGFSVTSENHYDNRCQQSAYLKTDLLYTDGIINKCYRPERRALEILNIIINIIYAFTYVMRISYEWYDVSKEYCLST